MYTTGHRFTKALTAGIKLKSLN